MDKIRRFLVTTLIGGLLVVLPIGLFFFLIQVLWNFVSRLIQPIVKLLKFQNITNDTIIGLIAFAIVVAGCFFIGLFIRTRFGKGLWRYFDKNFLEKLPFYKTIKDTVGTLFSSKGKSFKRVVLVEVMSIQMTGFVTDEHKNGLYTVFVPTAPNPTNGFIFHLPESKLQFLDINPEDAMRTVIGVGTGSGVLFGEKLAYEEE